MLCSELGDVAAYSINKSISGGIDEEFNITVLVRFAL